MKVKIIKGPLFESRKEETQKLLYSIIRKKVREQNEDQPGSVEKNVPDYAEDSHSDC